MNNSFDPDNLGKSAEDYYGYGDAAQYPAESYTRSFSGFTSGYYENTPRTIDQSSAVPEPASLSLQTPPTSYASPTWGSSPWDLPPEQPGGFGGSVYDAHDNVSYPGETHLDLGIQYPGEHPDIPYTPSFFEDPSSNAHIYGGLAANTLQPTPGFIGDLSTPIDEEAVATSSELSAEGSFQCQQCNKIHKDSKSRDRHVMEVHEKPEPGQDRLGWYRCKCSKMFCYFRKSNYSRHHSTCKEEKRSMPTYHCQCGREDTDKERHVAHYKTCSEGRRHVGRPPHSGVTPTETPSSQWGNTDLPYASP